MKEHAIREHRLAVTRTARWCSIGAEAPAAREVWFVLHGYGQLAPRFIRHFAVLDDGTRLIVAPEALNRFYLEPTGWRGAGTARVGATWMTREERLAEIEDYVRYLDALADLVLAPALPGGVRVTVLGFSQGVATAARWLCRGRTRAARLVLWAGPFPPEIDRAAAAPLAGTQLVRVLGDEDEMAAPEVREAEEARLSALGMEAALVRYPGGHRIDRDVLRHVAR